MSVLNAERDKLVVCCKKNPSASVLMFCFPFSGAGPAYFRRWCKRLPEHIESWAIQLPGREGRHADLLNVPLAQLVEDLAQYIASQADRPYVFFGHSLGAYLAWCTAVRIQQLAGESGTGTSERKLPMALFLSARQAPESLHGESLASLDDVALLAKLIDMGGIPTEIQGEPELLRYVLPKIRYDLSLNETNVPFRLEEAQNVLTLPLYVYEGLQDKHTQRHVMTDWGNFTSGDFYLRRVEGDHFYIDKCESEFSAHFEKDLRSVLITGGIVLNTGGIDCY